MIALVDDLSTLAGLFVIVLRSWPNSTNWLAALPNGEAHQSSGNADDQEGDVCQLGYSCSALHGLHVGVQSGLTTWLAAS